MDFREHVDELREGFCRKHGTPVVDMIEHHPLKRKILEMISDPEFSDDGLDRLVSRLGIESLGFVPVTIELLQDFEETY